MVNLQLLEEMAEYLGVSSDKLMQNYREAGKRYDGFLKWTHISEEDWLNRGIDQNNEKDVASFYQTTDNYIPELVEAWTPDKYRLSQLATDVIIVNGYQSVADYGAGIGETSIMHAKNGLEATAVDLPGKTFDFAKWRFNLHNLDINAVDIVPGELPLKDKYNAITCFEVLQHTLDPEAVVGHFNEHLTDGGLFLMTARFKGNYALALTENEKYHGKFSEVVKNKGFEEIENIHMWGPENENGKYLEVYQKK